MQDIQKGDDEVESTPPTPALMDESRRQTVDAGDLANLISQMNEEVISIVLSRAD